MPLSPVFFNRIAPSVWNKISPVHTGVSIAPILRLSLAIGFCRHGYRIFVSIRAVYPKADEPEGITPDNMK
jgi:hypothetical protein